MQSFRTFSQGILSIVATLLVFLLACEDTLAQGRRGGGRRRGAGGGVDLSPIRNDQYSSLPGGAYDLVKGNEETFRRLPLPIRFFVLDSLTDWDDFFPREKERFRRFFVKAGEASDGDLHAAFGDAVAGIFARRTGPVDAAVRKGGKALDGGAAPAVEGESGSEATRHRGGVAVRIYNSCRNRAQGLRPRSIDSSIRVWTLPPRFSRLQSCLHSPVQPN